MAYDTGPAPDPEHEDPSVALLWNGQSVDHDEAGDDVPESFDHDALNELQQHFDNVAAIENADIRFEASRWVHAGLAGY